MSKMTKDNAMLLDIQYVGNSRENKNDYLYIIWKNLDTGTKEIQVVPNPSMEIYFVKPEFRNFSYNKTYELIEHLDKRVVQYKNIIFEIAKDSGEETLGYLTNCFKNHDRDGIKSMFLYNYVFGADFDIRVWWRHKWLTEMDNKRVKPLAKGFMDIEVDIMEMESSDTSSAYNICPIDLVTVIDDTTLQSYTFCLIGVDCIDKDMTYMTEEEKEKEIRRREMYASRIQQQAEISSDVGFLKKTAHEMFDESYPGMEYNFYFYKDERKMLTHLFQLINKIKLDFIGIWNMPFDIPYIIDRMTFLGMNPTEVICPDDFPVKKCWFKRDVNNFDVKNRSDWFHCTSPTIFIDQMRNYAAIRKSGSELRSYALTYIAEKEIGDKKLDYSDDGNIKTLSYKNYLKYIMYNIKDVLLQVGIENRTNDMDSFYFTSYKNITPYENEYKQTLKLRNVQYKSFLEQGLVPGGNVNIFSFKSDSEETSFEGALVGDPTLNDSVGEMLYGKRTNNIFKYNIDMDMSRFYPSCISAANIEASTLIFKAIVDSSQYDVRGGDIPYHGITDFQINTKNNDTFTGDVAKEIFDNFQTRNYISTGSKWLNLPSVTDLYKELVEEGE